jgi:hypothetical protein
MKLFTKEILAKLPAIGSTDEMKPEDIKVPLKLFGGGACSWFITEYNPETKEAYGFVTLGDPLCAELGYISIAELEEIKFPPFGLPIERDAHFGYEHSLKEVMDTIQAGGHI